MAVYKRDIVDINLETGNIHRSFLKHSIGYKDQKADHFGIRTYRDGVPVDLTGVSVQGIFLPPQGDPIAITSGNIVDGNVAEVVLPQACYNYDGQFTLSIKLVDSNNSVTGTMRIVDGMVDNTHASGTVAPTSAVPTYQEILATYDAMVAATAAANGAIAATYSSSSTYKVGDYCIHDGGLYRCTTAITTAEAWTSGHWTAAKIGPDVSDLKSALDKYESLTNDGTYTIKSSDLESGYWGYSTKMDNDKRLRNKYLIPVRAGMTIYYTNPTMKIYFGVLETPTSNYYLQASGWGNAGGVDYPYDINFDGYMTFMVESTNTISPSDFDSTVRIVVKTTIHKIRSRFNGKKISIIGDSIDTYNKAGYKIDGYNMYYPALGVIDVDQTWWKQVIDSSGAQLEINASYGGSRVTDTDDTKPDFYARVSLIGNPDVVFVTLGVNDSGYSVELGEYDYETEYTQLSESKFRTAYIKGVKALKATYSGAEIVCIAEKMKQEYKDSIRNIATTLSCVFIDASDYKTADTAGVHPGKKGMMQIASQVLYPTDDSLTQKHIPADGESVGNQINRTNDYIDEQIDAVKNHCGVVVDAHIDWIYGRKSSYETGPASVVARYEATFMPIKVPESGIYIYYPLEDKMLTNAERKEYAVWCYHLVDGEYVEAEDYEYNMNADVYWALSRYIHYAENLYISISVFTGTPVNPRYGSLPHIAYGTAYSIEPNIPYMFPIGVRTNSSDGSIMDIIGNNSYYYHSYCTVYGTVIQLGKAKKVVCSPKYSLIAQVYKVDPNAQTDEVVDLQYSNLLANNYEHANGLPEIDLTQYDFDGYAIIGITGTFYATGSYVRHWERMGQLARYDDVLNNVSIVWENGITIEHDGNIPAKARLNIDTMEKYKVDTKSFNYGSWVTSRAGRIPSMKDSNFFFYTGSSNANVPLMHVNLESMKTVAKNPNGRLYKGSDVSAPNSFAYGFGSVCSTMAGLISGYPAGITTTGIHNDWYPDFEGRVIHNIEDIRPGDFLTYLNPNYWEYGHIVYVTDITKINGVIASVTAIEAWPPFFRFRSFVNYDAFPWTTQSGLLGFYSSREIGTKYDHASRLPYEKYRTLYESYGQMDETDYDVTGVMCDRGRNSVYCIEQSCEISIADSVTDTISVYCGSTLMGTINPASIERIENSYKVADISSMLTSSGNYTLKVNGTTMEQFYVASPQTVKAVSIPGDNDHVRVTFTKSSTEYPVAIEVFYKDYVVNNERETCFFVSDFTLNYIDVPKSLTKLEGNVCKFDYIKLIYRTSHGAFNVLIYNWLDACGLIDDPNPLHKQTSSLSFATKLSGDDFSDFAADAIENNGEYMLNILESGSWSYTTKSDTNHRLRSPGLIPVSQGMTVTYTNPSQDVYFGVAQSKTSMDVGFVTSGWINKGQTEGTYTIPQNGYLSIVVRSNPDATITVDDFDGKIVISSES